MHTKISWAELLRCLNDVGYHEARKVRTEALNLNGPEKLIIRSIYDQLIEDGYHYPNPIICTLMALLEIEEPSGQGGHHEE